MSEHNFLRIRSICVAMICAQMSLLGLLSGTAHAASPLNANDVTILFPLPKDDVSSFIRLSDLVGSDGKRLVSDETFQRFLDVAESSDSKIVDATGQSTQISFSPQMRETKTWFIAGIRLDLGAPGLSPGIETKFGQIPQIRLIVQPVLTGADGTLKPEDRAAHIIFSFVKGLSGQQEVCSVPAVARVDPDIPVIRAVLDDFVAFRDDLSSAKFGSEIQTAGPLTIHPGLKGPDAKKVRDRLEAILEKHLKAGQVSALAVMGLPTTQPEPWIFMAMRRDVQTGAIQAVPSPALDGRQKAQLLKFLGSERVLPLPKSDNQNPLSTCFRSPDARVGVSTSELLSTAASEQRTKEITGLIADPSKSHFFNTDCISCHTETRLLRTKVPDFSFPGLDQAVLPKSSWNVRNFGWGFEGGSFKPTVTRRTAAETEEVVKAANDLLNLN